MLPGPNKTVRKRSRRPSMSQGLAQIETVVSDSARRFRRLPTRAKLCMAFSLIFSILFYGAIIQTYLFPKNLTDELFLETDKCPACYGYSACGLFFFNRVKFTGASKYRFLDFINLKNVHFAMHEDKNVVLKKLAHDSELKKIDDKICADANRLPNCDVTRVIYISNMAKTVMKHPLQPSMLKERSIAMFTCGSYRLLDRLWQYYKERSNENEIFFNDKVQLLYISMVNTEPLLLQTFPAKEGWPFPEYYGACGRFIMVEYAGRPLGDFHDAPFETRVDLAYQIMNIAEKFTNNAEKFGLYWTDLNYDNLAVDSAGRVTVIDVENIIVVDKLAIEATKPKHWDDFLENPFDDCDGKNCLGIDSNNLCTHVNADHNYYAACRNLLSQYANNHGKSGGLLHDMPDIAVDDWDLVNLLNECARPTVPQGRWKVKDRLIEAFKNLRKAFSGDKLDVDVFEKAFKHRKTVIEQAEHGEKS